MFGMIMLSFCIFCVGQLNTNSNENCEMPILFEDQANSQYIDNNAIRTTSADNVHNNYTDSNVNTFPKNNYNKNVNENEINTFCSDETSLQEQDNTNSTTNGIKKIVFTSDASNTGFSCYWKEGNEIITEIPAKNHCGAYIESKNKVCYLDTPYVKKHTVEALK